MKSETMKSETMMEFDELKTAWQAIDRRLREQGKFQVELIKDRKLAQVKSTLRPALIGNVLGGTFLFSALAYGQVREEV